MKQYGPHGDEPEYLSTHWQVTSPNSLPSAGYSNPDYGTVADALVNSTAPQVATRRFNDDDTSEALSAAYAQAQVPRRKTVRYRRRKRGWAGTTLVLAVAGYLVWSSFEPDLEVTNLTVAADRLVVPCEGIARISARAQSNGGSGTIRYRWMRSDGTNSGTLRQSAARGQKYILLPMRWTFHGRGTYDATATMEILSPSSRTASVHFIYRCHGRDPQLASASQVG